MKDLRIVILLLSFFGYSTYAQVITHGSNVALEEVLGDYFFKFNALEHYHNDFEYKYTEYEDDKPWSNDELLLFDIVLNEKPESVLDTLFIDRMEEIGFRKTVIDSCKISLISEIFREKRVSREGVQEIYFCTPIYRDILVFKNNGSVIGIVKICFYCHQSQIVGTSADTSEFGQNKEFEKLESLLTNRNE